MTTKKARACPAGWNKHRVRNLAAPHHNQTEDEQVAEQEATFLTEGQTIMVVPTELVPGIVKLINEKKPA